MANVDQERYDLAHRILGQNTERYFVAARLSINYSMHIAIFSKTLGAVPFSSDEAVIYDPWLEKARDRAKIYTHAISSPTLTENQLQLLEQADDPALHIITELDRLREVYYPSLERDIKACAKAREAGEIVLRSIHSPIPLL